MKLPTLQELESLGFIKDISTPRQIKLGTTVYEDTDPLVTSDKTKLWIHVDKNTKRTSYKEVSTMPRALPDPTHFIYKVINLRLFLKPQRYSENNPSMYFWPEHSVTNNRVKKIIDEMSEKEFKARIEWTNKIHSLAKLLHRDYDNRGNFPIRNQVPEVAKLIGPFKMESN